MHHRIFRGIAMTGGYATCPGVAWRTVDDNTFVYGSDGRLHILEGPVAALLWSTLDSSDHDQDALVEITQTTFSVSSKVAQEDVDAFLKALLTARLIEKTG